MKMTTDNRMILIYKDCLDFSRVKSINHIIKVKFHFEHDSLKFNISNVRINFSQ